MIAPAAGDAFVDDPGQFVHRVRRMQPVAVGRFDEQDVGLRDRLRVVQEGRP